MEPKTWTTTDKSTWGDGPWSGEVDKEQFADAATGLPCLIKRSEHSGSPCGYVGVIEGHPWFGKDRHDFEAVPGIEISYSAFCEEGPEGTTICHVPALGEPGRVWWVGWHHGHAWDIQPAFEAREFHGHGWPPIRMDGAAYTTFADAKAECALVAQQAAAAQVPA